MPSATRFSDYFYSFVGHIYASLVTLLPFLGRKMQSPAQVEDIDSALRLLQDCGIAPQPIAFLQSIDNMISKVIQEVEVSDILLRLFSSFTQR